MKKQLLILLFWCFSVLIPVAGSGQEFGNGILGIVSAPLANVHGEPVSKSRLETQVLMGDEVVILEKQDNRYRVKIPNQESREGWIQQEAILIPKDEGRSYLKADRKWIVISAPKAEAMILDKTGDHKVSLYGGTRLPVLQINAQGRDYKVQFPDQSVAIIAASETIPEKPVDPVLNDTTAEEIAKTARQFLNVRYLSGGISAQGMDISGLIYIVFRIHGIPLSTDRASFKERAERVSKKEIEPGDILAFYGNNLGLYLGKGRFIQVPNKRAAQLAGIHDRRFAKSLQYGLRIIGSGLPNEQKNMAALTADEILLAQARLAKLPLNKRISYWAGRFIGTPYDTDPLGLYVRTSRIVADEKVDCMYLTFRSVELAQTSTPAEAVDRALSLRFITQGKVKDGLVTNYDQRFQYGEDMVMSGKWGRNITADLGATRKIEGSRGKDVVDILPQKVLATRAFQKKLQDGDIIYWVKDPKKRVVEEIVAHLSFIRIKSGKPYLIHASGNKDCDDRPGDGVVKEVPFADYVRNMRFIGAFVTRFEQ
jgi:cell wall-associated NlpC family hydrolase